MPEHGQRTDGTNANHRGKQPGETDEDGKNRIEVAVEIERQRLGSHGAYGGPP